MATTQPDGNDMNRIRITGTVCGTFPDRGFFWIMGEDDTKYFAHQTKVKGGFSILEMWEGQRCSFVPNHSDERGPNAEHVEME